MDINAALPVDVRFTVFEDERSTHRGDFKRGCAIKSKLVREVESLEVNSGLVCVEAKLFTRAKVAVSKIHRQLDGRRYICRADQKGGRVWRAGDVEPLFYCYICFRAKPAEQLSVDFHHVCVDPVCLAEAARQRGVPEA